MSPDCPGCGDPGHHFEEDQFKCKNPDCRVVLFHDYGQTGLGGFR